MPSPTMTLGATGNVLAAVTLAAGKNLVAVYRNDSGKFEDQIVARATTGTAAATSGVKFEVYKAYGTSTTLNGAVSAAATSIALNSTTGFDIGQKFAIVPDASNKGEMVTSTAAPGGGSIAVLAATYAHLTATAVYLICQNPTYYALLASASTGAAASSTTYAQPHYVSTGLWIIVLTNTDATNAVTVEITADTIDAIA